MATEIPELAERQAIATAVAGSDLSERDRREAVPLVVAILAVARHGPESVDDATAVARVALVVALGIVAAEQA